MRNYCAVYKCMLKFVVFTLKIVCLQVAEGNCYEMLSETIFVDCGHNALNEPNKENIPENEPSGSKQLMSTSFQPITFASINVDLDEKNWQKLIPSCSDKLEIMVLKKQISKLKRRCKSLSFSKVFHSSRRIITDDEFIKFYKETFIPTIFHFIKFQLESKKKVEIRTKI